jgi:hypothetical protein
MKRINKFWTSVAAIAVSVVAIQPASAAALSGSGSTFAGSLIAACAPGYPIVFWVTQFLTLVVVLEQAVITQIEALMTSTSLMSHFQALHQPCFISQL